MRDFRERIGIVLQSSGINLELTVRENLELFGAMYPKRRNVGGGIQIVGLGEEAKSPAARVAVIAGGRIVAEGTPDTLGGRDGGGVVVAFRVPPGTAGLP